MVNIIKRPQVKINKMTKEQYQRSEKNAGELYVVTDENPIEWGEIGGTITSQTDLINYIDTHGGKIDKIKVNDVEQTITNKTVNISVPTKTSDLTNDSDFQTSTQVNTAITGSIIDDVAHTDTDKSLSANMGKELNDRIDSIKARGRFLSTWDCSTGLAGTTPTTLPYLYNTGDYFIVSVVGESNNLKPNGDRYTGTASETAETGSVSVNDTYLYDGTSWTLLHGADRTVSFSAIAGQPTDNTNLAAALNAKVTANADITGATKTKITYDSKGLVTAGADLEASDIPNLTLSKITDVTATASEVNVLDGITATTTELNYVDGVTSAIQTQLNSKQGTLTAGDNITIASDVISAKDTTYAAGTNIEIVQTTSPITGYTLLSYVNCDGSHYIDTGVAYASNSVITMMVKGSENYPTAEDGFLAGSYPASGNSSTVAFIASGNKLVGGQLAGSAYSYSSSAEMEEVQIDLAQGKVFFNDEQVVSRAVTPENTNAYLFAVNKNGTAFHYGKANIRSYTQYNGTTKVLELVAAKRDSDNALGFYDKVGGTFKTCQGLSAGPVLEPPFTINCTAEGQTYTAGTGLDLNDNEFSVDYDETQAKLTAGAGIEIENNVISTNVSNALLTSINSSIKKLSTFEGYDRVSWMKSDGVTPFNLGVLTYTNLTTINMTWSMDVYNYSGSFFGCTNITTGCGMYISSNTIKLIGNYGQEIAAINGMESILRSGTIHTMTYEPNGRLYVDTEYNVNPTTSGFGGDFGSLDVYLFSVNRVGETPVVDGNIKIYGFSATRFGTPFINLYPVVRKSDSVLGFLDSVTSTFYPAPANYTHGDYVLDELTVKTPDYYMKEKGAQYGGNNLIGGSTTMSIANRTNYSTLLGRDMSTTNGTNHVIAIGYNAKANANYAIQLGTGTNTEASSFYVALSDTNNYKLLGSTGIIPADRMADTTSATAGMVLKKTASGTEWASETGGTYTAGTGISITDYQISAVKGDWEWIGTGGTYSTCLGNSSTASAAYSTALGYYSGASGQSSIAIGNSSAASSQDSTAIGHWAKASSLDGVAIGHTTEVKNGASYSLALGSNTYVGENATNAIAIGASASSSKTSATAVDSIAIGNYASSLAAGTIAIGKNTQSNKANAITIGTDAFSGSDGTSSITIGYNAFTNNFGCIAIGSGSTQQHGARATGSVYGTAIGYHAQSSSSYSIAFGPQSSASASCAIAIGGYSIASGSNSIAIGGFSAYGVGQASATQARSIAIGYGASSTAADAVQISAGTNSSSGTLKFRDFPLVSEHGFIPADRMAATDEATNGQVLKLNDGSAEWGDVDGLPSQSGHSGKYLKTNGTTASWESVPTPSYNATTETIEF